MANGLMDAAGGFLRGFNPSFQAAQSRQDEQAALAVQQQRQAEQDAAMQQMRDFQMQQAEMQNLQQQRGRESAALAMGGGLMGDTGRTPQDRMAKTGLDYDPLQYVTPQQVYAQTPQQQRQSELELYGAKKGIDQQYAPPEKASFGFVELDDGPQGAGIYAVDKKNPANKSFVGKKGKKTTEGAAAAGIDIKSERDLRKEFSSESSNFKKINNSYKTIKSIKSGKPSAAGDIGLIFGIMKMFDPGSVVREGEFATAQNAAGVPTQVVNMYNKVRSGQRLSEAQRDDFFGVADRIYQGQRGEFNNLMDRYSGIATEYGMDPKRIVYDYANVMEDPEETEQSSPVTQPEVSQGALDLINKYSG